MTADPEPGAEYASVMEAIGSYFGPERISGWKCGKCGSLGGVRVTKCRTLPRVLVVWLKRFRTVAGVEQRIGAPVHNVRDELDFTRHLDALAGAAGGTRTTTPNGTRYRTRAVVCHHGDRLTEGHYTCWVRAAAAPAGSAEDTWVHYDDSVVGRPQAELPATVAADAYLLFYELIPSAAPDAPEAAHQAVEIDATADPMVTDDADAAGEEIMDDVGESVDAVAMVDGEESDDAMDTT